jgi:RNA polymerase sigma-70 factor (ECF subfamily)
VEEPEEDDVLLTRSVGAPEAFGALVVRHATVLHGYLARRAPDAADDLLAEVWLRAFAGRGGFDAARGTARTWLFGIARNVLAAHWHALSRSRDGERTRMDAGPVDPWQAVDQRLHAASVAPALRAGLAELPQVERELLLLVTWEELSPTEAAQVVGVPAGTARSRLHRARGRMRELLAAATTVTEDVRGGIA